jgi:hypothetical protein
MEKEDVMEQNAKREPWIESTEPKSGVHRVLPARKNVFLHDARNLLSTILANLEFLNESLDDAPASVREALGDTWESSRRMSALLQEALAPAKDAA